MAYTTFDDIKLALKSIINFDEGGGTRYGANSGSFVMTENDVVSYINEAEAFVLRKLSTLYAIPLTSSVNSGTTLDDFDDMTKYNLKSLFIDATCVRIVSYAFAQQGNSIQLRNYLHELKSRFDDNMLLSLEKDISGGIVYPAFQDLELSAKYLTREQNPIPTISTGSMSSFSTQIINFGKY
jgi:hypothetical protein